MACFSAGVQSLRENRDKPSTWSLKLPPPGSREDMIAVRTRANGESEKDNGIRVRTNGIRVSGSQDRCWEHDRLGQVGRKETLNLVFSFRGIHLAFCTACWCHCNGVVVWLGLTCVCVQV